MPDTEKIKRMRPRDAATLVLVRRARGGAEVLLGRRHGSHAFMPHRYVFPGGRVDAADARIVPATPLRADVAARLTRSCTPARARALAIAAIRETYEEVGLMIAAPASPGARSAQPPWADFTKLGLAPDLAALDYICRAVTPPQRPRRFNARFFVADGAHARGSVRGNGELENIAWVRLEAALELPIPEITGIVLKTIGAQLDAPPPADADRPVPVYHRIHGHDRMDRE